MRAVKTKYLCIKINFNYEAIVRAVSVFLFYKYTLFGIYRSSSVYKNVQSIISVKKHMFNQFDINGIESLEQKQIFKPQYLYSPML